MGRCSAVADAVTPAAVADAVALHEPADELAALDEVAGQRGGQPALAVLVGPGGVGKTALAVTWGGRQAERYPDGQLYADLCGFSPGTAVSPEAALGAFLRALGVAPERVPPELAEQAALFRTITAGRRLLVVLDNAVSAAQVRPLIPASAACMVVVTSRLRLDGLVSEGARFVDIGPLSQPDAVELVVRAVGRARVADELAEVAELASLCGRLPIALRVASARLASRPRWPVARVVAELGDERSRLRRLSAEGDAPVTALFDWSYRALPEPAAKLSMAAPTTTAPASRGWPCGVTWNSSSAEPRLRGHRTRSSTPVCSNSTAETTLSTSPSPKPSAGSSTSTVSVSCPSRSTATSQPTGCCPPS
jgi:hypothetical protein